MLPHNNINKSSKTIYINPNFKGQLPTPESDVSVQSRPLIPKNAHINPLFLEAHKYRHTIHMNPAFLHKLQEHRHFQQPVPMQHEERRKVPENEINNLLTYENNEIGSNSLSKNNVTTESRKIICKSKNRLIREPLTNNECPPVKQPKTSIPLPPLLILSKRKLIRKVSTGPVLAPAFRKSESKLSDDSAGTRITKYKLDNRVIKKKALLPPTPKIKRTSYVGRYALRRISLTHLTDITTKSSTTINKNINKKLQVLNINGLLYKSTRNSLKLKNISTVRPTNSTILKSSKAVSSNQRVSANENLKVSPGLTIFVRGTKYVMDANKFKLTRVTNADQATINIRASKTSSNVPTCKRIDIGGYTYISVNSAKNVLIRTTNHLSRAYVHNAKQKSLLTLTKRLVKTNIPCPIFQRIGKCAAFDRGKCSKVHNKLQVAICSRFLRGECLNAKCLLSHNVSLSKMPVCKFFLQGVCVRNDCPYLHKKLSNKAELCIDFLRGFCLLADKCNKRHEFACPEIERNHICTIKNCIYCNAKRRRETQIEKKTENFQNKEPTNLALSSISSGADVAENVHCKRYFICEEEEPVAVVGGAENANVEMEHLFNESNENNGDENKKEEYEDDNVRKSRPKLGILPSYIPL